jgi:hypothetical protein
MDSEDLIARAIIGASARKSSVSFGFGKIATP